MSKIEIGAGFMVAVLSGFDVLQSLPANVALVVIAVILIGHGTYEDVLRLRWRLRERVTHWLVNRHWLLETETSPNFHFALWATDMDLGYRILIGRDKADKGILTFSAIVPLAREWLEPLARMPKRSQQLLVEDLGVFINTMRMGFDSVIWPLRNLAIQTALPIDNSLSEHAVDLQAKAIIHAITGTRRMIRKAVIQSGGDTQAD